MKMRTLQYDSPTAPAWQSRTRLCKMTAGLLTSGLPLSPPSLHILSFALNALPNLKYSFLQLIACTYSCPALVVWDQSAVTIIELTVPFELCFDAAVARKTSRYSELLASCRETGFQSKLITIEVGSRGLSTRPVSTSSRQHFQPNALRKNPWRGMWSSCISWNRIVYGARETGKNLTPTN